ncbi:MAG: CRISPR-associated protein Cas5 [Candidatus Aenigmatarchaeota archaeon]|nr:CRISPR-associated protein Cas5 [Candidatus Rehaiarchaeum fermentans]
MQCFIFKLSGRFGHFRKFYTTASALSHDFPPPMTIKGIIGSVIGYDYNECIERTKELQIGIVIEKIEGDIFVGLNLLQLKDTDIGSISLDMLRDKAKLERLDFSKRTQANKQILINPSYKIYICGETETFYKFTKMVEERKSYYYTYLGKTSCPALLEPIGYEEAQFEEKANCVKGVIPIKYVGKELLKQGVIFTDRIPISLEKDRAMPRYKNVLYITRDEHLKGEISNVYKIGGDYVYLFSS